MNSDSVRTNEHEKWKIRSFKHWAVYLNAEHPNYLGSVFVRLLRDGVNDFMDVAFEEREEFFQIGHRLETALWRLFHPDCFDWGASPSETSRCSVHLIPRYRDKRLYEGIVFCDYRWGKSFAPFDIKFAAPNETLESLRGLIESEIAG